jgi:hypothetical protein
MCIASIFNDCAIPYFHEQLGASLKRTTGSPGRINFVLRKRYPTHLFASP